MTVLMLILSTLLLRSGSWFGWVVPRFCYRIFVRFEFDRAFVTIRANK